MPKAKRVLLIVCFCLGLGMILSAYRRSPETSERERYEQRLTRYLLKSPDLRAQISLSDSGIALYDQDQQLEYALTWAQAERFTQLLAADPAKAWQCYQEKRHFSADSLRQILARPTPPPSSQGLEGWRIALDPGHFAGSFEEAEIEGRRIDINLRGQQIRFYESRLAWFTAKILKDSLESRGAEVMLTRQHYGHTAFGESYQNWFTAFAQKPENREKKLHPQQVFTEVFRKLDAQERVRKINAFAPDLTLVTHYNVDASNRGWNRPTAKNNALAFVGGSFMEEELEEPEARFHLLRLLLSDDFEQSVRFSKHILEGIAEHLDISPIPARNGQPYLKKYCLPTQQEGIYSRNLTLVRQVHGAICYAEPLYQNNLKELELLSDTSLHYDGQPVPYRLQEVAEAYLRGILRYAGSK